MFNIIYSVNNRCFMQKGGKKIEVKGDIDEYIDSICLIGGTTFKGSVQASKKLLPKTNKVPIYIPCFDDYIIPLASPISNDCIWLSAKNYLTCYERDERTFIRFKDHTTFEVLFSKFTIRMQYRKYLQLNEIREDMKIKYNELKE